MKKYLVLFMLCCGSFSLVAAPKVVVTISPIHVLTEAIMDNVAEPILLVNPGASPHNYALKPSQVADLNSAQLVIWVGETLETFLINTLKQLPKTTTTLTLLTIDGLNPLPIRTSRTFLYELDHTAHDHIHAGLDPHVWLDPIRTKTIAIAIQNQLIAIDPSHEAQYKNNTAKLLQQLTQLDQQLQQQLSRVKDKPFIVFHDAYQYVEKRYHLKAVAAITLNPEITPSAKHISTIQQIISQQKVVCLFAEPQFQPAIVHTLAKETGVRIGTLNPEGTTGVGFSGYQHLMTTLSNALYSCLS